MAKTAVRQPQTGNAWSGDATDPAGYALKIANALHQYVEYSIADDKGKFTTWIEVYPTLGLPPVGG